MQRFLSRSILLLLFLALLAPSLAAQRAPVSYLALGDSYTIGEQVSARQRWPRQLARALRDSGLTMAAPTIIAQTGWTTTDLRSTINEADLNAPYDLVSLLIGVNDQYDGLDFEQYPRRFEYLLQRAIALAGGDPSHVVVVSIPDYSVTPFGQQHHPDKTARELARYNAVNKQITERLGARYVNITPGSRKAADDPSLLAGDGLHPSGAMYRQWVHQIVATLWPDILQW